MEDLAEDIRPAVSSVLTGDEFERWYWSVAQLHQFCEAMGLSARGLKSELRERVAFALRNPGALPPKTASTRRKSSFSWSKATLTRDTVITDTISFGPNVRRFFGAAIGPKFVCHSDFMDWMKANTGLTLADGIAAWHILEERKSDPSFRREIAECNNYLQYLRDLRDAHPTLSLDEAKQCWDAKKIRPAQEGLVVYEPSDMRFL
ncbi:MAG: DUF6434 domain-containing protein [Pseudomonadota bacterium]